MTARTINKCGYTSRKAWLAALLLAMLVAVSVAFAGANMANATVPAGTRDLADGDVTVATDTTGNTAGVTGAYWGNWANIGENHVMLLSNNITFRNADVMVTGDIKRAEETIDFNLTPFTFWNPVYFEIPNDYTIGAAETYDHENEDGTTDQYPGKEINPTGTLTLEWKNAAVLKDGTLCDVVIELSNFHIRLNQGQSYAQGDQVLLVGGGTNGNGLWAYSGIHTANGYDPENRPAATLTPGVGFDATLKVVPVDSSTCADHNSSQMIYYFSDLDVGDRGDGTSAAQRFNGKYAESVQLDAGVVGPVIIEDKHYSDLTAETASNGLYGNPTSNPDGRLINTDRLERSQGTWISSSHATTGTDSNNEKAAGFVTLVNPDGFTFHWRGQGCGTRLIAQSIPGAELAIIPGTHFIASRNPGPFNEAVLRFLL